MLSDAQIERYGRQILLADVGVRGQERLLAARVWLIGDGPAATVAATLVERAGVRSLVVLGGDAESGRPGPDIDVVIDLRGQPGATAALARSARTLVAGVASTTQAVVATLVGRPCGACLPADALVAHAARPAVLAVPTAFALGALAAAEATAAIVDPPATGRLQAIDLATGAGAARVLPPGEGCRVCGARR